MTLQLLAALVRGLKCGSELNVAAFAHPTIGRQPMDAHILMRSSLARLFGKVMPFWMAGSTLLSAGLLLPFAHLDKMAWRLSAISLAIQVMAVIFISCGACADQQPNRKMDTRRSSQRLASARATLGSLPLAKNMWANCRVRATNPQR
jgi:hypothetical protein